VSSGGPKGQESLVMWVSIRHRLNHHEQEHS
jgi:hypothetical protein